MTSPTENNPDHLRLRYSMLQQTLAVFLVLGLLLAGLWLLQRKGLATLAFVASAKTFGKRSAERRLRLMERVVLTPQHSLHLVSLQGRLILFATSPGGCHPVPSELAGLAREDLVSEEKNGSCLKSEAAC